MFINADAFQITDMMPTIACFEAVSKHPSRNVPKSVFSIQSGGEGFEIRICWHRVNAVIFARNSVYGRFSLLASRFGAMLSLHICHANFECHCNTRVR
jgi:hypothetical protein